MSYANKEEARAYAKAHYLANKHKYNIRRGTEQLHKLAAKEMAADFAQMLGQLSYERFIYPDELHCLASQASGASGLGYYLYDAVFSAHLVHKEVQTYGMFLGNPPFAFHPLEHVKAHYRRQLDLIPRSKRGVRAEILILKLMAKEKMYGC